MNVFLQTLWRNKKKIFKIFLVLIINVFTDYQPGSYLYKT